MTTKPIAAANHANYAPKRDRQNPVAWMAFGAGYLCYYAC